MGNQDVDVVKSGELKSKIVYLVKGHQTHAQLQYDGTWSMCLNVAKINYYGKFLHCLLLKLLALKVELIKQSVKNIFSYRVLLRTECI